MLACKHIREDCIRLVIICSCDCTIESSARYVSAEGRTRTARFARVRTIIDDNGRKFVHDSCKMVDYISNRRNSRLARTVRE